MPRPGFRRLDGGSEPECRTVPDRGRRGTGRGAALQSRGHGVTRRQGHLAHTVQWLAATTASARLPGRQSGSSD
jgi:hypothetical protein